ncbi:hypothetical protein F4803DRAFT_573030 [Xylaria telfairii]|nr:hypothetical protein F4803DRAFT_573030 [Xylaria telfairii]
MLRRCLESHRAQWSAFKIPQILYTAPQTAQSSTLLALPNELLLEIFVYAGPAERLYLALTCKQLLIVSSMISITIPSAPKHRVSYPDGCMAMLRLLDGMLVRNTRGEPKDTSSAVCHICYRYRPKNKRFWKGVEKRYSTISPTEYSKVVKKWCHRHSPLYQCPECWCEWALEHAKY